MRQQNGIIEFIKENITTRVLELFAEKKEDFEIFYERFSKNITLAVHMDSTNNQKLTRLLQFSSTQSSAELTSFDEYVEHIKPEQKGIYWIYGETQDANMMSPMLDYFQQKGIELFFLTEPIKECCFQQPKNYSDHRLLCITKENCEIAETDDEKRFGDLKTKFDPICNKIKHILGKDCEKVVTSKRLVVTPCARFMNDRALRDSLMSSSMQVKILELNATHPAITRITNQLEADDNDQTAKDVFSIL
jgi:molecular chaperone HtpG